MSAKSPGAAFAFIVLVGIVGFGLFAQYSQPHNYEQPAKAQDRQGPRGETLASIRPNSNQSEGKKEGMNEEKKDRKKEKMIEEKKER